MIMLLALLLLFSGCGSTNAVQNSDAAVKEDPPAAEPVPQETAPSTSEAEPDITALSQEELQYFTSLFETPEYNGFLEEPFRTPGEINWNIVLRSGAGIAVKDPGEDEING